MKIDLLNLIDFEKVDILLEGFNKSTGFVTAILDLEGNVLSKSGWRQICTDFHRIHPETSKLCTISDTELAGKLAEGEKYHFYKCHNGLVDVAVPVIINGKHIANLFSGQFFFEEPDKEFFRQQSAKYGFDRKVYLDALEKVPVVSKEKVKTAMDFLLNMTQLISEMTYQKLELLELNRNIKESEDRFSTIFKSSPSAVSIERMSDGVLTEVNDSWCQLVGFSAEEAIGHNVVELQIMSPETREKIQKELVAEGKLNITESTVQTKSGEIKNILSSAERISIGNKQFSINLATDITERKKTEDKLKENERHLRNSQKIAHLGSWRLDLVTNQVIWTDELYAMYGFDPSLPPPSYTEHMKLFTPSSWEKLSSSLTHTRESGIPYELELETVKKDGSNGWMWVRGEAIKNPDGQITGLWGAAQDITERKQAEKILKESEEKFRNLFQNHAAAKLILDPENGRIMEANKAAAAFYGCPVEELQEKKISQIFVLTGAPTDVELRMVAKLQKTHFESTHLKADGTPVDVEVFSSSIDIGGKEFLHFIIHDITEKKKVKKELEDYRIHLEELVAQRTKEIDAINKELVKEIERKEIVEKRLNEMLDSEKELVRLKSRFISTASHEFRTPLSSILSSVQLIQRYGKNWPDEKFLHHIDRITNSIDNLTYLMDNVLIMNRIESGKTELMLQEIDLYDFCTNILEDYKIKLNNNQKIVLVYETGSRVFELDTKQLMTIFQNLISNAIKYSPEGGTITIRVSTENEFIIIKVSDEGIGIPLQDLPRLFEPFHRAINVDDIQGTGLGLSIVKSSVDLHKGTISVESNVNVGTVFTIKLPKDKSR